MKLLVGLLMVFAVTAAAHAAPAQPQFKEGENYRLVVPVQPTDAGPNQVQVIEFFWYGCPHCYAFEPYLENWAASQPDNVLFKRVPAVINPGWKPQARAFYTARVLGVVGKLHKPIFDEIHLRHHFLHDEESFQKFFAQYGISKDQFDTAWNSFAVDTMMKQAAVLGERYRIMGVPTVVVAGKYITGPTMVKSFPELIQVIDFLVNKTLQSKR
ncbi:MAG TPA: thiol:disulfide interchange protein DsbA/DsbL [Gammaproteobacteria bacterium]|nr:thiol:disulfide interchange protein DsbA/DsbL [Gammaproteobacteria bacterium]